MKSDLADSPLFSAVSSLCAEVYTSDPIYLRKDALVIFTCGAATSETSVRDNFINYTKKYFKHGSFFKAEDAFPVLVKARKSDLLTIEHKLADYSDCVLIINESPGTLAELGAFATNEKVVKKLLVVNPKEHIESPSFINLGPIAKADKKSRFKKTIHVDLTSASIHFDDILKRIEDRAGRKRRITVNFSENNAWKRAEGKLRLLFLQDIINLFSPFTRNELLSVMKSLFPNEYVKFDIELGLLLATNKVMKQKELLVATRPCADHSYDVDQRIWLGLRKRIIDLYRLQEKSRLYHLIERSAETA